MRPAFEVTAEVGLSRFFIFFLSGGKEHVAN